MEYIDLHAHMVSRTTDDYRAMAMSGCVAVTEPAFWAGYDRPGVDAFIDYFNRLTDFEPTAPPPTGSPTSRGCASTRRRPRTAS